MNRKKNKLGIFKKKCNLILWFWSSWTEKLRENKERKDNGDTGNRENKDPKKSLLVELARRKENKSNS